MATKKAKKLRLFHETHLGKAYLADSVDLIRSEIASGSVDLIVTSPPFGLVRKKDYGNRDADQYLDWFRPFAESFRSVLNESGSLVIDIGGAGFRDSRHAACTISSC